VITGIGGTLGLTGAYGVSDSTITRRRVEADLAVFREYQVKYRGMKEACIQQLDWGVERYAQLPQPPELLKLEHVPPISDLLLGRRCKDFGDWVELLFGGIPIILIASIVAANYFSSPLIVYPAGYLAFGLFLHVVKLLLPHFKAKISNGDMPQENARRQKAYDAAVAAALKKAEPLKAAEDHRLRVQIRELEGSAKTVSDKEAEVRRLLPT